MKRRTKRWEVGGRRQGFKTAVTVRLEDTWASLQIERNQEGVEVEDSGVRRIVMDLGRQQKTGSRTKCYFRSKKKYFQRNRKGGRKEDINLLTAILIGYGANSCTRVKNALESGCLGLYCSHSIWGSERYWRGGGCFC